MVHVETFGGCEMPEGWESLVKEGAADFEIKTFINEDPDFGDKCVLGLLDNNKRGDLADITLTSPWITPLNGDSFFIDFKLLFIKVNSRPQVLEIFYEQGSQEILFERYDSSEWGATFNDFADKTIAIDNSSREPVRVVVKFQNNGWSDAAVTLDNFIFRGDDNHSCETATRVVLSRGECYESNNLGLYDGRLLPSCSGIQAQRPVWFAFTAPESGIVRLSSQASFNDVIDVYYGLCGNLTPFRCTNRDEHGFLGESLYFPMTKDINYYIRVSGYDEPYSSFIGDFCLEIETVPDYPQSPNNDFCTGAYDVQLNGDCVESDNFGAGMDGPEPSLNTKSKADVWFKYVHTSDEVVNILTNADFSDVITVYSGSCLFLSEVVGTDQGPSLERINLQKGQEYFIQVSGYFSTLEGNLCLEVEEAGGQPPINDLCSEAQELLLNDSDCLPGSTEFAELSGIRPSCKVKPGADIWYTFNTSNQKDYRLEVNADFQYSLALFTGSCDSLIERYCDINPHRCEGYISLNGLSKQTTYWIQVSSQVDNLGLSRGQVCVSLHESGKEPPQDVLRLSSSLMCIGGDLAVLEVNLQGGKLPLEYIGNNNGDIIAFGEPYSIIVDDQNGCRQINEGYGNCQNDIDCELNDLTLEVNATCLLDRFGLPTGQMQISVAATGGQGQLEFFGNTDGDVVDFGSAARVAVRDETGCLRYQELANQCDPFTCEDSKLDLTVTVECIDSLLRAKLLVSAVDGNGVYNYSGNLDGELLENGQNYMCIVEDETGCIDSVQGMINCNFDSCAFSGLTVAVDYDCIVDSQGQRTGRAVLRVSTRGGVGILQNLEHADGDTLMHGEIFRVVIMDEWGCESMATGEINCSPTSTSNLADLAHWNVYPNPSHQWMHLSIESQVAGELKAELINIEGKTIFELEENVLRGSNLIPLVYGSISSGVYQLKLSMEDKTASAPVTILP